MVLLDHECAATILWFHFGIAHFRRFDLRTKTGQLLMLWASYDREGYVQTVARSESGKLACPWKQLEPLVGKDSGHGMLFKTFAGQLMMVLHQPFRNARGKLFDMEDTGNNLKILRSRHDLDGPAAE